ncbi:alpha/beta fold hydrolase [Streptomyces sp. KL116D]|uniref:alpha/beta fold hydrolase n=1 Tax=Streptomyces sp. KL116D TaxID=3045152 RepID=UPI0035576477
MAHSGGPGIGWEYLRTPELEKRLTMVYVEPVGTGRSGRLPDARDYTVATYARLLHHVVDHLGQPRVHLSLGHSHGGFVAQQYALDHPDRLASSSCTTPPPWRTAQFWSAAVAAMERFVARNVEAHPEVAGYTAALTTPLGPLDDDGATAVLRQIMPAYVFDYWGREGSSAPPAGRCGCPAAPRGRSVRRAGGVVPRHRSTLVLAGGRLHLRSPLGPPPRSSRCPPPRCRS